MPNVVLSNLTPYTVNHAFSLVWSLSRAMIKAGWTYLKSSDGTTTFDATGNVLNDKWGAPTSTGNTGSAASLASKTLDDITVTGLTGMSTASVGRFLTIGNAAMGANNGTFQIVAYVSATSVKIRNSSGVAPDGNNGSITWTERDHALQTYATVASSLDTTAAWILLQGPSTIRVPINANPSPAFRRGEKVTQAVTLAEGEVLGVAYNTASDSYMVIQPRIGTFDSSNVITGAWSGATATPSATIITYVCEVVLAKTTDVYNGWIFYQRVNTSTESTSRFSSLTPANATAPGNGTGLNAFPSAGTFTVKGNPNSTSGAWLQNITTSTSAMMSGRGHVIVANAIGNADVSPDGTFWVVQALPGSSSEHLAGWGLSRMDDTEDGDVDPYTWVNNNTAQTRITCTVSTNPLWAIAGTGSQQFWATSPITHLGWRRRGLAAGDAFASSLYPCYLYQVFRAGVLIYNQGDPDRVAATNATLNHREAVWVIGAEQSVRLRKGTHRWLFAIGQGAALNVWDSKTWLQVTQAIPTTSGGIVIGPWDGSSDPIYV